MFKEWGKFLNVYKKALLFISICGSDNEFICTYDTFYEIMITIYIIDFMFVYAVFALANLMNVKEDHSQLSAIARYPFFLWSSLYNQKSLVLDPSFRIQYYGWF